MLRFGKPIFAALAALSLTGCGLLSFNNPALDEPAPVVVDQDGNPVEVDDEKAAGDFLDNIGNFAREDLKAAMVLAGDADFDGVVEKVGGDPLSNQCWFFLHAKLEAQGDKPAITVAGIASALQLKRNIRREGGLSDEFKAACGGLIMDTRSVIRKRGLGILSGCILG